MPCNKFISYIPPHHKHIKARMNMEHKATEAALYENTHYRCWHLPIFPGRRQPSIFGTTGLNFRVRDGNGWTPCVINRLLIVTSFGSPSWTFPATTRLTAECSGDGGLHHRSQKERHPGDLQGRHRNQSIIPQTQQRL